MYACSGEGSALLCIHFCYELDIDECQEATHLCDQTCTNTVGSYMCQCNAGYSLGIDETACFGKISQIQHFAN